MRSVSIVAELGVDFKKLESDLEGRTKPVVSKSTLARTMKVHGQILQRLSVEISGLRRLQEEWRQFDEMKERMEQLEGDLRKANETIAEQQAFIKSMGEVATYGDRMATMQEAIKEMQATSAKQVKQLDGVVKDTALLRTDVGLNKAAVDGVRTGLEDGSLAINAASVRVEGEGGTSVEEVLRSRKMANKRLEERILEVKEDVEGKGEREMMEENADRVKRMREEVAAIHTALTAVGIDTEPSGDGGKPGGALVEMAGAFEKQTGELRATQAAVKRLEHTLLDKADLSSVDAKIELKYQEIIDHLQSAMSSAADDEQEFKTVSSDLRNMISQLMTTKADMSDVAELQARLDADDVEKELLGLKKQVNTKLDRADFDRLMENYGDAPARPGSAHSKRRGGGGAQRSDIMREVKALIERILRERLDNPVSDAGWATSTAVRPGTGDGMRGQHSLVCISCNARIKTPAEREAEWEEEASRPGSATASAYGRPVTAGGAADRAGSPMASRPNTASGSLLYGRAGLADESLTPKSVDGGGRRKPRRSGPTLGPGGPSLGGGFQVRLPPGPPNRGQGPLPQLAGRPASPTRVVIGGDGTVYPGAVGPEHRYPEGDVPGPDRFDDPPTPTGTRGPAATRVEGRDEPETDARDVNVTPGRIRPSKFNPKAMPGGAGDPSLVGAVATSQFAPAF